MSYAALRPFLIALACCITGAAVGETVPPAVSAPPVPAPGTASAAPVFKAADRSVSTWRMEAAAHLNLAPDIETDLLAGRDRSVARCVKLNNYWCIKKAGWAGEIAADREGHVAFSGATEGAAVAALLLKRYYVDFHRKTALAIISRWAPAQCGPLGSILAGAQPHAGKVRATSLSGRLGTTLRARWLATHARGFVTPAAGLSRAAARPRRSVVSAPMPRLMPTPQIAAGLGPSDRAVTPITLDALLQSDPRAPRSRSMLGLPSQPSSVGCVGDGARIAAYAGKAAAGITAGTDGDLGLFDAAGVPTANLAVMMANMAHVEIGPLAVTPALIQSGIAEAFKPGRNPS